VTEQEEGELCTSDDDDDTLPLFSPTRATTRHGPVTTDAKSSLAYGQGQHKKKMPRPDKVFVELDNSVEYKNKSYESSANSSGREGPPFFHSSTPNTR
jgi:hypothetical protein